MFQKIDHHQQQERLQLKFDYFQLFRDYFSMASPGFTYTSAVVVHNIGLVDDELSVISIFLLSVL